MVNNNDKTVPLRLGTWPKKAETRGCLQLIGDVTELFLQIRSLKRGMARERLRSRTEVSVTMHERHHAGELTGAPLTLASLLVPG